LCHVRIKDLVVYDEMWISSTRFCQIFSEDDDTAKAEFRFNLHVGIFQLAHVVFIGRDSFGLQNVYVGRKFLFLGGVDDRGRTDAQDQVGDLHGDGRARGS
jgi:hypothetical protein